MVFLCNLSSVSSWTLWFPRVLHGFLMQSSFLEYFMVSSSTLWFPRVLYGFLEYFIVSSSTLWFPRVLYGFLEYFMVSSSTLWFPRVLYDFLVISMVSSWTLWFPRVFNGFLMYSLAFWCTRSNAFCPLKFHSHFLFTNTIISIWLVSKFIKILVYSQLLYVWLK